MNGAGSEKASNREAMCAPKSCREPSALNLGGAQSLGEAKSTESMYQPTPPSKTLGAPTPKAPEQDSRQKLPRGRTAINLGGASSLAVEQSNESIYQPGPSTKTRETPIKSPGAKQGHRQKSFNTSGFIG